MNSFEMDLKRAFLSKGFLTGLVLQTLILFVSGANTNLFYMSVPVLCSFPYATAWLADYQNGFLRLYLSRTSRGCYIGGKILACAISGGAVLALAGRIYIAFGPEKQTEEIHLILFFLSGMLWSVLSAVLAAWSDNRYIAYGGGFVLYYLLIILHERYFNKLYCLYPLEWLSPEHIWIFGDDGIILLLGGLILICMCLYSWILWRCMECY